jgi:hypothetical protein
MTLPKKSLIGASLASTGVAAIFVLAMGLASAPPARASEPITTAVLREWMLKYSNWGRWGKDDQLGTVNFITFETRKAAADLVKLGLSVSMARRPTKIKFDPAQPFDAAYPNLAPKPTNPLDVDDPNPFFFWANPPAYTSDRWNFAMAGIIHSHLDSLCHIASPPSTSPAIYPERMVYNGRPLATNNTADGCRANGIENVANAGIFTRGVLYDATSLGYLNEGNNPWLAPGTKVTLTDILMLESRTGVRAGPGDVILLYTGHFKRRAARGPWASTCTGTATPPSCGEPGWWYDNIPFFYDRQIAQFGSDAWNDVTPAYLDDYTGLPYHGFQASMGIAHYDNLDLEALADVARRLNRYEFLFTTAPFPVVGGITSPVNPIGVF